MKYNEILGQLNIIELMKEQIDEDTGEFLYSDDDIQRAYDNIEGEKENKIKAIQHIIDSKKLNIELCKEEKQAIDKTIKQDEKSIINLNDMIGTLLNGEGLKTSRGSFYYGKESLYIEDESTFKKTYPQYVFEKQSITKHIDKNKVIEDIENVDGARLRTGVIFRAKKDK